MEAGSSSIPAGEATGRTVLSRATHRCPICPERFIPRSLTQVNNLLWHLINDHKVLHDAKEFCPICGAMYTSRWYIRKHIQNIHFQPPSFKGTARPRYYGPSVKCRICSKEIGKHYIQLHLRAHYNKTTQGGLVFSLKSKQLSRERVHPSLTCNDNSRTQSDAAIDSDASAESDIGVSMSNYSIYELLGTINVHYSVIKKKKSSFIELYPSQPNGRVKTAEIVDNVYSWHMKRVREAKKTSDVITLDSDSDEGMHVQPDAKVWSHDRNYDGGCSDSDVELLVTESKNEQNLQVAEKRTALCFDDVDCESQRAEISIKSIQSLCKKEPAGKERDKMEDRIELSSGSEDEDDLVAELEQYVEDNELLEELEAVGPLVT